MLDKLQNSAWPDDNNCAGGRSCTTCWVHGSQATNKQFNFVGALATCCALCLRLRPRLIRPVYLVRTGNPTVDISTNSLVVSGTVDASFDVPAYVQAGWRVPIFHWCWFDRYHSNVHVLTCPCLLSHATPLIFRWFNPAQSAAALWA